MHKYLHRHRFKGQALEDLKKARVVPDEVNHTKKSKEVLMENSYIALSRKDVSAGVERKGNLDYLSWAYAWNALCEEHPEANFYFRGTDDLPR